MVRLNLCGICRGDTRSLAVPTNMRAIAVAVDSADGQRSIVPGYVHADPRACTAFEARDKERRDRVTDVFDKAAAGKAAALEANTVSTGAPV